MINKFLKLFSISFSWALAPAVSFFLSILLTQIPLFNSIGYEFALVFGLLLPFFIGYLCFSNLSFVNQSYSAFVSFLIPPLIMCVNMLFIRNCTYLEGVLFFILSSFFGSIFTYSLARFIISINRQKALFFYVTAYLGIILIPTFLRFYFTPQIFFFNHIFGFFSGAIYDEAIEIHPRYFWFRIETLLISFLLLLFSFRQSLSRRHLVVIFISTFPLILPFELGSDELGFTSSHDYIKKSLVPIDDDGYWRVDVQTDSLTRSKTLNKINLELTDLKKFFALDTLPEIHIFVYPTPEAKKQYTGAENVDFTKIWRNEIHISQSSFSSTIRHELTHIIFGRYGIPFFGISRSIGLVEGIASAYESPSFDWTKHELASSLVSLNLAPDVRALLGPVGFWTGYSATSYTVMASFVQYLVETYGIEFFKDVYKRANFYEVYGKSIEGLVLEWREFLSQIPSNQVLDSVVVYRFKRQSIFQVTCPHAVANKLKKASKAFSEKNFSEAAVLYQEVLNLTESKNLRAVQGLFGSLLYIAIRDSLNLNQVFEQARQLSHSLEKPEPFIFTVANAMLWTKSANIDTIQYLFERVKTAALSFNYDYSIALRKIAIKHDLNPLIFSPLYSPSQRDSLLQTCLFSAKLKEETNIIEYLMAERELSQGNDSLAFQKLLQIKQLELPECEFQLKYDLLELALSLKQDSYIPTILNDVIFAAQVFEHPKAKLNAIDCLLKLYNYNPSFARKH